MEKTDQWGRNQIHLFGLLLVITVSLVLSWILTKTLAHSFGIIDIGRITKMYSYSVYDFHPEPQEFRSLVVFTLVLCLSATTLSQLFFYLKKYLNPFTTILSYVNPILIATLLSFLIVKIYPLFQYNMGFYTDHLSISLNPRATVFFLILLILCWAGLLLLTRKYKQLARFSFIIDITLILVVVYCSCLLIFNNQLSYSFGWHFSPVFNPIYELWNGHVPGVDFRALYGFYGYFFWIVEMFVVGQVNMPATTVLLGLLTAFGNVSIYIAVRKMVNSRVIAFLSITAVLFFSQLWTMVYMQMPYYQYIPIRTFMPSLMFLLITMTHFAETNFRKRIYIGMAFLLTGAAVFWNPETGVITSLSFLAYLIFSAVFTYTISRKQCTRQIVMSIIGIALSIVFWFGVLELMTYLLSGELLRLVDIFWGITVFARDGFYMIPVPEKHPYLIVILLYALAVIIALFRLFQRKAEKADALGFTLGAFGLGLITYFLGRSHDYTFALCVWPAFLVIPYLIRVTSMQFMLLKNIHVDHNQVVKWLNLFVMGAVTAILSIGLLIVSASLVTLPEIKEWQTYLDWRSGGWQIASEDSIALNRYRAAHMAVIDAQAPIFMSNLGLRNEYVGTALVDYLLIEDYQHQIDFVETYKGRLFIGEVRIPYPFKLANGETYQNELARVLAENYTNVGVGGRWQIYDAK